MEGSSSRHNAPVIIKKIKKGGHGHHGGAWKVAYADFVTAMMALFIVLWIIGQSKQVKESVAQYFRDPGAISKTSGGLLQGAGPKMQAETKLELSNSPLDVSALLDQQPLELQKQILQQIQDSLLATIAYAPEFESLKDQIEIEFTSEGLRIELLEKENSSFFEIGSAKPAPVAVAILRRIAEEAQNLTNDVVVEGHTDSRAYSPLSNYTNWELSIDRANSARRVMSDFGLRDEQIAQVRGYADRKLRYPDDPYDVRNRRVSIAILYDLDSVKN
jgi:chemotaxis protein MotB